MFVFYKNNSSVKDLIYLKKLVLLYRVFVLGMFFQASLLSLSKDEAHRGGVSYGGLTRKH
jgi:hypothetical protein